MDKSQDNTERRRHKRHTVSEQPDYTINFRTPNEERFHNASSANISYGGIMFISDKPYACNSEIETVITFSGNDEPDIILSGRTKWVDEELSEQQDKQRYSVGIQFSEMSELQEIAFRIFVDNFIINY